MKRIEKTLDIAGKKLTLTTGHVAEQATSAVMARMGDTMCLVTVVAADLQEDRGYFPLSVEYQERLYAGGRIKGSRWVKREGRPTDDEILTARLIDRSIRPLFPSAYNKDVQVIITVLSVDMENSPDMVAAVATSAALAASDIPWEGPVGTLRVGQVDDKFVVNPTREEMDKSDLDLIVSATDESIVMIECGAKIVDEKKMLKAIKHAEDESKALLEFINDFAKAKGVKKEKVVEEKISSGIEKKVKELAGDGALELAAKMATKEASYADYDEYKAGITDNFEEEDKKAASKAFEKLFSKNIRDVILSGKRVDGRKHNELRDLSAEVGIVPRVHGSGLFHRGQTQGMSIVTLGSNSDELMIETAEGEETRRYFHHYGMPPYSVGETGRVGSPKRREIGHGALGERAILPVLPSEEEFPYTIRVVTEILSGNGSTSMASVCGSTLSLMDAGVPISAPVAGIAMGVIVDSKTKYAVLTDIVGLEDGNGDMDFKVAGTKDGITALQLDVKTLMLTSKMLGVALDQAKEARLEILSVMEGAIKEPRESVGELAPKIKVIKIDTEKIGELIGPSGKTIKKLSADTGAEINVEDDGSVTVSAIDQSALDAALEQVEGITKVVQPGEMYTGEVTRMENFGVFVEILPNKSGLVHISDMSNEYVKDPADLVSIGDTVEVKVKEVDDFGRINLTMVLDGSNESSDKDGEKDSGPRKPDRKYSDRARGNSRGRGRNDRRGGHRGNSRGGRSGGSNFKKRNDNYSQNERGRDNSRGGPHFPASRLMDDIK